MAMKFNLWGHWACLHKFSILRLVVIESCLSQLIAHYDKVLSILEKGSNIDVIYLDFAKAFDKLDFNITLQKHKQLGIDGKIGRWLHLFLTDRQQTVLVNG